MHQYSQISAHLCASANNIDYRQGKRRPRPAGTTGAGRRVLKKTDLAMSKPIVLIVCMGNPGLSAPAHPKPEASNR